MLKLVPLDWQDPNRKTCTTPLKIDKSPYP
jgi:hypothetical protein